jgi:hypothetical protein
VSGGGYTLGRMEGDSEDSRTSGDEAGLPAPHTDTDDAGGEARAVIAPWLKPPALRRIELVLLFGLWVIATIVIWRLAVGHVSPRRFQDEFLWSSVAESLANGQGLSWRGVSLGIKSPLYPLGIAPAYLLTESTQTAYHTIHFINSMMMCAVVFPVYLLGRRYVDWQLAGVATMLALAAPAMNYAGIIGTEALAYPAAALAGLAIALLAAEQSLGRWMLALAGVTLAILTRTQFVIFVPILLGSLLLAGLMRAPDQRREFLRANRWPLVVITALLVLGGAYALLAPGSAVGLYKEALTEGFPDPGELWFWVKAFTADVFIVAGIVPAIAAIAMFFRAENRRDPMLGALLATTLVASLFFVAEVGWFAANNDFQWRERHIFYERYMFYVGPLYFVLFMTSWRRVSVLGVLGATSIAAVVIWAGLHKDLILIPFSYDAFGLTVVGWLLEEHPQLASNIGLYVAGVTVVFGWILAASAADNEQLARIGVFSALTFTFVFLLWNQAKTWQYARLYSPIAFTGVPKPVDWIDRKTDEDVGMVVTETDSPEMYFSSEFWNERITRAFATDDELIASPVMYSPRCEFDWSEEGEILGTGCDRVPRAFYVRNGKLAIHLKDPELEYQRSPDQRLLIGRGPVAMISMLSGRDVANGEAEGEVLLRTFADEPGGTVAMRVKPLEGSAKALIGDREFALPAGRTTTIRFDVDAGEQDTRVQFVDRQNLSAVVKIPRAELRQDDGEVYDLR